MTLVLNAELEERIQREMERGHYGDPAEVIAHALDLLPVDMDWNAKERATLDSRLAESRLQIERGEFFTPEEARRVLSERRAARQALSESTRSR